MIWVCISVGIVAILAVIDWTARPHGGAHDRPAVDADVTVPRPRTAEHDRSVVFTRRIDQDSSY